MIYCVYGCSDCAYGGYDCRVLSHPHIMVDPSAVTLSHGLVLCKNLVNQTDC